MTSNISMWKNLMTLAATQTSLLLKFTCQEKLHQENVEQRLQSEEVPTLVETICYLMYQDLVGKEIKQLKREWIQTGNNPSSVSRIIFLQKNGLKYKIFNYSYLHINFFRPLCVAFLYPITAFGLSVPADSPANGAI